MPRSSSPIPTRKTSRSRRPTRRRNRRVPADRWRHDTAGAVAYTPEPDCNAANSATHNVGDGFGRYCARDDGDGAPVDDAPEAADDAAETDEDTPVAVDILDNEVDLVGDAPTVDEVSTPRHGTARVTVVGAVEHAPRPDPHGTDRFTYVVSISGELTATGALSHLRTC